jgi:hypothetical protein
LRKVLAGIALLFGTDDAAEAATCQRHIDGEPGGPELQGSLLVAPVGQRTYVYTGLALFRQLPAGVPGAYRLFANLLALGRRMRG